MLELSIPILNLLKGFRSTSFIQCISSFCCSPETLAGTDPEGLGYALDYVKFKQSLSAQKSNSGKYFWQLKFEFGVSYLS